MEITAAETANYLPAKVTLTIEVAKADAPDFRLPAASKITYGQKLSESALSGDGPGSFAWEDGSILPPAGLNTYNVVLTPDDRDNYNWPQEKLVQAIEIIVDKKYVRLTVENAYKSYGDVDPAAKVSVLGTLEGDSLDYSISRKAGENVGQYAYIVSEGSNPNYTLDMLLGTLTIQLRDIAADKISVSAVDDQTDTGFAICPEPTVTFGGVVLVPGRDYALSYSNNIGPGRATITITGQGNFSGSRELSFTINPKPTAAPTAAPTAKPTASPTVKPTAAPSFVAIQNDALQEYLNSLMLLVFDAEYAPVGYVKIPVLVSDEETEERILLISASQEESGEPAQRSLMLDAAQLIRLAQLMQEDEDGELTSDLLFENGGAAARVRIAELTGGKMAKLMTLILSGEEITDELLQSDWSAMEDAALTEAEYKRFRLEVRIAPVTREDGRQGSEISVWLCHGDAKLNVSALLETLCVTLDVDHLVTNGNADAFESLYAIAREFEDEIELLDSTLVLAPSIPAELIAREVDDAAEKGTPTLAEHYVLSASYAGEGMYWVVATDLR